MSEQNRGGISDSKQEYFQSQYIDARNVLARFAMYGLELCNHGETPFDQETEVVMGLEALEIASDATIMDMGTSDAHLLEHLSLTGFRGKLIGSDANAGGFIKKHDKKLADINNVLAKFILPNQSFESIMSVIFHEDYPSAEIQKQLINASANEVPIKSENIDVYIANNMLYHLLDIEGAIQEAKRTLNPDGIFVASTSGQFNKLEHREAEEYMNRRISEATGLSSRAPLKMNDGFTTEKAKLILPRHFEHVYLLNHEGVLLIKNEISKDIYRNSLYSMYDQFNPLPDKDLFISLVDEVIDSIGEEGKLVRVSRSVFFCSDLRLSKLDPKKFEEVTKN